MAHDVTAHCAYAVGDVSIARTHWRTAHATYRDLGIREAAETANSLELVDSEQDGV